MSRDLEERYLETRDRNLLLRKKNNEQEQTIKRLYTKIQMIEEGLRRRGHGSTMDASKSKTRTNKMDDVATSKLITDLKKRNMSLQKANTDLREKLRLALMENRQIANTPGGKRRILAQQKRNATSRKGATHHGGRSNLLPRDENLQGMLKSFANTTNNVKHDKKTKVPI